jgi:hypothetical protein
MFNRNFARYNDESSLNFEMNPAGAQEAILQKTGKCGMGK